MAAIEAHGSCCHLERARPEKFLPGEQTSHLNSQGPYGAGRVPFATIIHDRCRGTGISREAKARKLNGAIGDDDADRRETCI